MQKKRVLSLILALAVFFSTVFTVGPSFAEENPSKVTVEFEIVPVEADFDSCDEVDRNMARVSKNGKYGYINAEGRIVIPIIYEEAAERPEYFNYDEESFFWVKKNGKYGLIDSIGKIILPFEYENKSFYIKEGIGCVKKDGKYGFIDKTGKLIIPPIYDDADVFPDVLISVQKGGKWGGINKEGTTVIPFEYESLDYIEPNFWAKKEGKYGVISPSGKVLVPFIHEYSSRHSINDEIAIEKDGRWMIVDNLFNVILDLGSEYERIAPFYHDLAYVKKNGKWGYIDRTGKEVIPCESDDYEHYVSKDQKLIRFVKGEKYGFIDRTGKIVVPVQYDYPKDYSKRKYSHFSEGMRTVVRGEKIGYIDENGREIISTIYDSGQEFFYGVARVGKDGKFGFIDKTGKVLLPLEYDSLTEIRHADNKNSKEEPYHYIAFARKVGQSYLIRAKLHKESKKEDKKSKGYVYDEADKGEGLIMPTDELSNVTDKGTAVEAVTKAIAGATEEQKASATGTDLLTLYGEEAALRVAKTEVKGSEFVIDKASVEKVENASIEAKSAVEAALKDGGVTTQRELSSGVTYEVKKGEKLSVKVDASSAEAKVGNVRVETPTYSLSFNKKALASIKEESAEPLEITVTELPASSAELIEPRTENPSQSADFSGTSSYSLSQNAQPSYSGSAFPSLSGTHIPSKALGANILEDAVSKVFDIKFSKKIKEKIKLSLPVIKGNPKYQAVYDSEGKAIGGKYNPVTKKLDVKINKSDKYVVKEKKKSFADITSKSKEMQDAIEILASKGIIAGTSPTNFSPDGAITRAEIAALILRSISKLNPSENGGFSDVASTDWYFGAVGSAKRHGIMKGVSANLFAPKRSILKDQIVAVAARVLKEEMGYIAPAGPEAFLASYTDAASIPNWAKSDVALATREGLVVKRYDKAFIPAGTMTRGDVAVILHRLFKKLW